MLCSKNLCFTCNNTESLFRLMSCDRMIIVTMYIRFTKSFPKKKKGHVQNIIAKIDV